MLREFCRAALGPLFESIVQSKIALTFWSSTPGYISNLSRECSYISDVPYGLDPPLIVHCYGVIALSWSYCTAALFIAALKGQ